MNSQIKDLVETNHDLVRIKMIFEGYLIKEIRDRKRKPTNVLTVNVKLNADGTKRFF